MKEIKLYTTQTCPFCHRAKALLDSKQVVYNDIDVTFSPDLRSQMREEAGGSHTVPQIFVGDIHVGGCDDLFALEQKNELDALLASE